MWTYDGKNVARVAYVVDNSQICIEQCRILDMNMMWIINLYFYIGCKWRWDTNDTSAGALFFFIPSFFIVAIVDHIYNKLLCHHMPVLFMNIIAWSLVLLVYIFYKYNDRGVKIIAYYNEYTQIRKWYINTIIGIAYFCAFCLITYCSFKIIDCIL